jgi:DNA-binding response OmpR family regulator
MHTGHQQHPSITHSILLVDDDPDIRSLIRTFLEEEGYGVYTSGDADRAVQIFQRRGGVDLLITDYSMSKRNGIDLAQELRSSHPNLPVLVISGLLMDTAEMNQLEVSGLKFLSKPLSLPRLLSEVHNILHPSPQQTSATLTA